MSRKEIESKVNEILVDKLGVEHEEITNEARFEDDLHGDSLDCVEIIMEIEKVFDILVKNEDAERCKTVEQIYDLVENAIW